MGTIAILAEPETLWVMKRVRDVLEFTSSLLRISGWKLTYVYTSPAFIKIFFEIIFIDDFDNFDVGVHLTRFF